MKTQNILIITLALLSAVSCRFARAVAGNEPVLLIGENAPGSTVEYPVADFSAIEVNVPCEIDYFTSQTPSVVVSGPENIVSKIEVTTVDGTLKIGLPDRVRIRGDIDVKVSSPTLSSLKISGAAEFEAVAPVVPDDLTLQVNGAAEVSLKRISARDIRVTCNGASDLDLEGVECNALMVEINGAGDLEVEALDCGTVSVNISGAGDVKVGGRAKSADLEIHGAGDIDVRGLDVPSVNSKVSGLGKVRRK